MNIKKLVLFGLVIATIGSMESVIHAAAAPQAQAEVLAARAKEALMEAEMAAADLLIDTTINNAIRAIAAQTKELGQHLKVQARAEEIERQILKKHAEKIAAETYDADWDDYSVTSCNLL